MTKFLKHESAIAPLPKTEGDCKCCTISSNIASMSASHCQIPISPGCTCCASTGVGSTPPVVVTTLLLTTMSVSTRVLPSPPSLVTRYVKVEYSVLVTGLNSPV